MEDQIQSLLREPDFGFTKDQENTALSFNKNESNQGCLTERSE